MAVVEQDEGEGQSREEDRVLAVSRADNAAVGRNRSVLQKSLSDLVEGKYADGPQLECPS